MDTSRSKLLEYYEQFTQDMIGKLASDDFHQYFVNALKSGECNISLYEKFVERNIDLSWVEMIEDSIVAFDTIIRTPLRYIKNEEEIVPIEMVRTVSTESIRHLAQHTNISCVAPPRASACRRLSRKYSSFCNRV